MALVAHSTPVKRNMQALDTLPNTAPLHPPTVNSVQTSPRVRRARLIKMKLQLAYYKVRTNQTHIPTSSLKLDGDDDKENRSVVADNNETIDKNESFDTSYFQSNNTAKKVPAVSPSTKTPTLRRQVNFPSRLDDVVTGKSKANRTNNKVTKPTISSQSMRLSLTSPSRFAHTSKLASKQKPANIFIPRPRNIFNTSLTMSGNSNTTVEDDDLTVEDPDQTILHTSLTNSIPPPPLSAPLIPTETPLRRNKQRSHSFSNDTETQILSSPSRLLSTPSSIGAARCLLQLAHR